VVNDLDDFVADARAFLERVAKRRNPGASQETDGDGHSKALFRGATIDQVRTAAAWQRQVFDAGYAWITGPVELGGRGLSEAHERAYLTLERGYDVPSRAPLSIGLGMVAPIIEEFGTPEIQNRWLVALHRGDAVGCQLFSEPEAGSDLASVATTARIRDDGEWLFNGQKVWTSGAHHADVGLAIAKTADEPRYGNLTAFVIDMQTPGIDVRPLRQMTGGADFNEVFLDDVAVPDACRLGAVGDGWSVAIATLMHERNAVGRPGAGGAGVLRLTSIVEWVRGCEGHDRPEVADALARVYGGLTAAKWMRQRSEAAARAGQRPGPEMSLSKLVLTRNLAALSDLVELVLGPQLAARTDEPETWEWVEFVLGVPGMRIGGGTDEIQRNIIGERVLGLPKEPKAGDA